MNCAAALARDLLGLARVPPRVLPRVLPRVPPRVPAFPLPSLRILKHK